MNGSIVFKYFMFFEYEPFHYCENFFFYMTFCNFLMVTNHQSFILRHPTFFKAHFKSFFLCVCSKFPTSRRNNQSFVFKNRVKSETCVAFNRDSLPLETDRG